MSLRDLLGRNWADRYAEPDRDAWTLAEVAVRESIVRDLVDRAYGPMSAVVDSHSAGVREGLLIASHVVARPFEIVVRVTTAEELDALPVGVVIRSAAGTIAARADREHGVCFGITAHFPWLDLTLPVTVLYRPGVDE